MMGNCVQDMPGSPDFKGLSFKDDASVTINPGGSVDVFSYVTPANTRREVEIISATCRVTGTFRLKIDGNIVESLKTSPSEPNVEFKGEAIGPIDAGEELVLSLEARAGGPATATAEASVSVLDFPA